MLVTCPPISSTSHCWQKTVHSHAASQTWWHQLPPLHTPPPPSKVCVGGKVCVLIFLMTFWLSVILSISQGAGGLQTTSPRSTPIPAGFPLGSANGRGLEGGKKGEDICSFAPGIISAVTVVAREHAFLGSWAIMEHLWQLSAHGVWPCSNTARAVVFRLLGSCKKSTGFWLPVRWRQQQVYQ